MVCRAKITPSCFIKTSRSAKMVKQKLYHAGVAKVEIERSGDQTRVIIHTARPGIIIGRKGAEVDKLKADS